MADALQAERSRVQLALPTDLARWRAAQGGHDPAVLLPFDPADWLQGFRLPAFDGFEQWRDEVAQQLQAQAQAAAAAQGARHPSTDPAARAPPGREVEWRQLLDDPAAAIVLFGEPGAGKTTLLQAAWPQAPCLRGLEGLHTMPYRPLLVALRQRLPALRRAFEQPSDRLRPYRLDLARVLPELAVDEALPALDALTARSRLVEALTRAFESLGPVLWVDDLQWCDAATLEWLLLLAQTGRLRWRAAARRHEMGTPLLLAAFEPLRRAGRWHEVELNALHGDALARLCRQNFPDDEFSEERLARLATLSGGNALLLVELVRAGAGDHDGLVPVAVQQAVGRLVTQRMRRLPPAARHAVEAAAVFVQPVPAAALRSEAPGAAEPAIDHVLQAIAAGLLQQEGEWLSCRHDLIRQEIERALPQTRRQQLHRDAAAWLANDADADADALTVADHWRAAGEPQTALAWCHRGAAQLKARGRFDAALDLWRQVADESLDPAQSLRARLEIAACDLFEQLAQGEAALEAICDQLPAIADPGQRRELEGRVKAALVDNRVFAGDIVAARGHAARLRELLPELPPHDRWHAIEGLIELAMREPNIAAAWALLGQLRTLAPGRPTLLSFEGQIHWFSGQVQAAHDALARLLERHPDHCRGITVENDLAVMLQALGRLPEAEAMARRSLRSWAGVAHTETLSLLVLGLTLTSAGRHDEADDALCRARELAIAQASTGFEAEARVRRARLLLQRGDAAAAERELDAALPLLRDSAEPLRVSQLLLTEIQVAAARGRPPPKAAWHRLQALAARSRHPLVHTRLARAAGVAAAQRGDGSAEIEAAHQEAMLAKPAGLLEPLAEAHWLEGRARCEAGQPGPQWQPLVDAALALAERQGFAALAAAIGGWRASNPGAPGAAV